MTSDRVNMFEENVSHNISICGYTNDFDNREACKRTHSARRFCYLEDCKTVTNTNCSLHVAEKNDARIFNK